MSLMRILSMALLVLVTVVTSGPMASAKMSAQGQLIVICTGEGVQTIRLGPDGEPVPHQPHCPDCTVPLLAAMPVTVCSPAINVASRQLVPTPHHEAVALDLAVTATARGPPNLS